MKSIRIISYNILFGRRIREILVWLGTTTKPDILCFQEFPKLHIHRCLKALEPTRYSYAFSPGFYKNNEAFGELTLWKRDVFSLKKKKTLSLGQSRIEKNDRRLRVARTALVTTLLRKNSPVIITNLQLSALSLNALRYKQLQLVISETDQPHVPVVLIGDFNVPTISANHKLSRSMKKYGFEMSPDHFATYRLGPVRYQLDYLFTKACRILSFGRFRLPYSDHYPVFGTVQP